MSFKKDLFLAISARAKAEIPNGNVFQPGINEVNIYYGQLDIEGSRPAVGFPFLGIDFSQTNYVLKQLKTQWAEIEITMVLAFDTYNDSSSLAPDDVRLKALWYMDIEHRLYEVFQYWTANGLLMKPMIRMADATQQQRTDGIKVVRIVWKAAYEDKSLQAYEP